MKTLIGFFLIFSSLSAVDVNEIFTNIDDVQKIQNEKKENKKEVKYDPFSDIKKEKNKPIKGSNKKWIKQKKIIYKQSLALEAIFGKAAFINGKWYKKGDRLDTLTVKEIKSTFVVLQSGKRVTKLTLTDKEKNFLKIRGKK